MLIYVEIQKELDRQKSMWGQQEHHPFMWLTILGEEFGEACKHCLEKDYSQYRKELIEVAAVAMSAVESLDRNEVAV